MSPHRPRAVRGRRITVRRLGTRSIALPPLVSLRWDQCRYPDCGERKRDGSSYCDAHHQLCHTSEEEAGADSCA
jgi:hypothetical protein